MKKTFLIISAILLLFCFGNTVFAQKKSKPKKPVKRVEQTLPAFDLKKVTNSTNALPANSSSSPCQEDETLRVYGVVRGENTKPPAVKKPCSVDGNESLKILSRPQPGYTPEARQNNVTGSVYLKVTFLKSGQIGDVAAIRGLPDGLTQRAILAAKRISFKPEMKNGVPVTITKQIQYNFSVY